MTMPLILLLVLVVLALAALRYGVDSRDSADWNAARRHDEPNPTPRRHTVRADLAALGRRLTRVRLQPQGGAHSQYPRAKTSSV